MSPAALVADLEARGVTLAEKGGHLSIRPSDRVAPAELELIRSMKPEVLAFLRSRVIGLARSRFSLYQLDRVLEVAVPWADVPLILAPGCRIARELRAREVKPGSVWCVCEVLDLLLSGVAPGDARKVAEAKMMFDGVVHGARGRP